ncbi:MAG: flagellar protein FliS [Lachnospiraceae bacterium]|nr:flagellar protein FliS [Lachnospiraceae bacterium]
MTTEKKQTFTRRITQANRSQLVVIVYEMLLVYLEDAMNAYEEDKKEDFRENLRMARECIGQMRTSLNFDYNISRNLFAIYCFADREIAKDMYSLKKENLDVIKMIFTKLHDAYYVVSTKDESGPLMDNIQTVYAGLTYSKSDLNEDFMNYDIKRGYLA